MERVALEIGGMSCGHCVQAVDRALAALNGVEVEQVAIGSAVVAYDPSAVQPDEIGRAVSAQGYEVRGMEKAT